MPSITLTVTIEPFTIASTKGEGYSYLIDPSKWTPEYVAYLCEYSPGVIVQRSTAALTDKAGGTKEEREKARKAAVQKILDGVSGRVGGGLSREETALRDALEAQKFKFLRIPTGTKTDKGNEKTTAEPVAAAFARFAKILCDAAEKPVNDENKRQILNMLKATVAYKTAMGEIDNKITLK